MSKKRKKEERSERSEKEHKRSKKPKLEKTRESSASGTQDDAVQATKRLSTSAVPLPTPRFSHATLTPAAPSKVQNPKLSQPVLSNPSNAIVVPRVSSIPASIVPLPVSVRSSQTSDEQSKKDRGKEKRTKSKDTNGGSSAIEHQAVKNKQKRKDKKAERLKEDEQWRQENVEPKKEDKEKRKEEKRKRKEEKRARFVANASQISSTPVLEQHQASNIANGSFQGSDQQQNTASLATSIGNEKEKVRKEKKDKKDKKKRKEDKLLKSVEVSRRHDLPSTMNATIQQTPDQLRAAITSLTSDDGGTIEKQQFKEDHALENNRKSFSTASKPLEKPTQAVNHLYKSTGTKKTVTNNWQPIDVAKPTPTTSSIAKPHLPPMIKPKDTHDIGIHSVAATMYLPVPPIAIRYSLDGAVAGAVTPLLLTYYQPLKGMILTFKNVQARDGADAVVHTINEYGDSFLWVSMDVQIFRPTKGAWLQGLISIQTKTHMNLLVWNFFSARIERKRLPSEWRFIEHDEIEDEQAQKASEVTSKASGKGRFRKRAEPNQFRRSAGAYYDGNGNRVKGVIDFRAIDYDLSRGENGKTLISSIEGSLLMSDFEEIDSQRKATQSAQGQAEGSMVPSRKRDKATIVLDENV